MPFDNDAQRELEWEEWQRRFEVQCEQLPFTQRGNYVVLIQDVANGSSIEWLTARGILSLRQAGVRDVIPSSGQVALFHRVWDGNMLELPQYAGWKSLVERYVEQTPFRRAWESALESLYARKVDNPPADMAQRVLEVIGKERLCTQQMIEARLGISAASVSRAVKSLREQRLVQVEQKAKGPGRPTQLLRLSPEGIQRALQSGLKIQAVPEPNASKAVGERLTHQQIATVYLKYWPDAQVLRAYSDLPPTPIASPLGSIVPDVLIQRAENRICVEEESGQYNYQRLRQKLDKYLASEICDVYVIAERQDSPTRNHVQQWLHDSRRNPPQGTLRASLQVHYTTLDQLQRFGPDGNIWIVFQFRLKEN